jgi:hypothetical protein
MRKLFLFITSVFILTPLCHSQEFSLQLESFKNYKSDHKADNRAIEGASPILGHELVMDIKNSLLHPEETYEKVLEINNNYDELVFKSASAYFKTLHPGLDQYCSDKVVTGERSNWTSAKGNHGAAIPQEVIGPVTDAYIKNLDIEIRSNKKISALQTNAAATANSFQKKRYNCPNILKFKKLEKKIEKFCLGIGICVKSSKIHSIISSAEAAYPRKQFSINGFTRYVYNELLKTDDLKEKIKHVYDTEVEWINKKKNNETDEKFFAYVINESIEKNIHIKDVMLILAYSMRNMPSLDVEYALAPKKALLMETYFWSFRKLRSILSSKEYFQDVFPKKNFKRNPGFYHYLTAALLGCEARLANLGHNNAILLGIGTKVGYKLDKLMKALDKNKMKEMRRSEKRKYVMTKMKKQGTWAGIIAGKHAGRFGSKVCQSYKRKLKKEYRKDKRSIDKSLPRKERKEIRKELKSALKASYRNILKEYKDENL